ncbi:MAG TPA: flagellar basal body P-ring formation chaperone FlgA [Bryobacteraceae bacterium]|nr:flagellar basal body P-ring formation chaperone FlgA [Bryobacteraceae bacterium]
MNAWFLIVSMLLNPSRCETIRADQITGEDLARAVPGFSAIPRDAIVGFSPVPGGRRVFIFPELARIARKYGFEAPADARACFEWKMQPLTEKAVQAAIRESLHSADARIDVLATSKAQAPEGELVFPLSGLSASTNVDPSTPVTWRGEVLNHSSHRFTVWARVRIAAQMPRVVAKELLLPGKAVNSEQVALETVDGFPLRNDLARKLDDVVGRAPLRAIKPGAPVLRSDLREPYQVQRGDNVQVTAISGAAQLRLEAVAENPGKQGDVISLKNPRTGRTFRARVDGQGKALIIAGPFALWMGAQ